MRGYNAEILSKSCPDQFWQGQTDFGDQKWSGQTIFRRLNLVRVD